MKEISQAPSVCRAFIWENGLSKDDWCGGYVLDGSRQVAFIDYDGNIRREEEGEYRSFYRARDSDLQTHDISRAT